MLSEEMSHRDLFARVWPFAAVVALALALSAVSPHSRHGAGLCIALAAGIFVAVPIAIVFVPWPRFGRIAPLVPVAGYCLAVALLRQSAGGGSTGYGPLVLLPIAWEALYGTRRELSCTVAMVAATFAIPILWLGGSEYPGSQWPVAIMFTATSAIVGNVIHGLVNERYGLVERLQVQAHFDGLTGLLNRRACEELLNQGSRPGAGDRWLSFIDLDRFKDFNDAHGHGEGDDLLRETSRAWQAAIGDRGTLGRWGGEEFLLLYDGGIDEARAVLADMAARTPAGQTFSAGVVPLDVADHSWSDALARADLALYRAKRSGRNRVEVASATAGTTPNPEWLTPGETLDLVNPFRHLRRPAAG